MSGPDYSELAARALASRPEDPRPSRVDRDRGISVIAQAMAERTRRRRARRVWFGGFAAAAALALAAGGWLRFGARGADGPAACDGQCEATLTGHSGQASFPPGSHWTAGNTGLSVGFGSATRVDLEPSSEVLYRSAHGASRFRLLRGTLRAQVEKLEPGRRFIVETHDAEVEVRGTSFEVAVAPAPSCGTSTSVAVHEGVVEVRALDEKHALHPGERWPAGCPEAIPQPAPEIAAPSGRAPDVVHSRPPQAGKPRRFASEPEPAEASAVEQTSAASSAPPPPRSSLVEQNDLYARAVAARRSGQPSLALELYAELARRFPASALVESALVERMRILQKLDPSRASTEARGYLRRFPRGFARDEAREVAGP